LLTKRMSKLQPCRMKKYTYGRKEITSDVSYYVLHACVVSYSYYTLHSCDVLYWDDTFHMNTVGRVL
jgi:hypothetical protein